jgi:hypothetical protein
VGAAFGSKFLYFADPHGRALILDRLLRAWLAEHAGVRLRGARDEREYAMWLLIAEQWSKALKIPGDQLELVIFSDALPPNSPWRLAARPTRTPRRISSDRRSRPRVRSGRGQRVILLGCVKQKLEHRAAAKDLYVSPLWSSRRAYAEASGAPWLVLSAKHGLLEPGRSIAPYDVALAQLGASARRQWGDRVLRALERQYGSLAGMTFEIHAGEAYRTLIKPGLRERGAALEEPLAGLTLGRQLAWYRVHAPGPLADHKVTAPQRQATPAELRRAILALEESPVRIAAADWPADLQDIDEPGLYSWWVDEPGAKDLSDGLGHTVGPGRIYAGQTGATKWPSGRTGAMTLAKRIGRNHLNGRIRGSTFRLTLAAILASPQRLRRLAPGRLDRESEQRLSQWMRAHLHVAVHRCPDRDALADLEQRIVTQLEPPLNLAGLSATPIRDRLTVLRRQLR